MKNVLSAALVIFSLSSCKTKKAVENSDLLPKDITLKPENNPVSYTHLDVYKRQV